MLFSLSQSIVMFKRVQSAVINHTSVILFAQGSPIAYGPSIVLSKVYANSMMVFLNDRILSERKRASQTANGPFGSINVATTLGPAETAQVTSSGGSHSTRSSMSERSTIEDPSKQNIPAWRWKQVLIDTCLHYWTLLSYECKAIYWIWAFPQLYCRAGMSGLWKTEYNPSYSQVRGMYDQVCQATISLAINTVIACTMIWSVRDQSPLPLLTSRFHSQLTKNKILSQQLKSEVSRLVYP